MKQSSSQNFLKVVTTGSSPGIKEKAILNRRANEYYNRGEYAIAKRIYLTTRYSDGLTRLGKYYEERKEMLEALRMYWIAGDSVNKTRLIQAIAGSIQRLIHEEDTHKKD